MNDPRFEWENVLPQSRAFLRSAGIEDQVPLIAAGGIGSCEDIARLQSLGAAGAQLGTASAVTTQSDAHLAFNREPAQPKQEDLVEFTGVAGLPARAVATPWPRADLGAEAKLQAVAHPKAHCTKAFDCLAQCGLRDGLPGWGQFCIDNQLAAALRGGVKKGLVPRCCTALRGWACDAMAGMPMHLESLVPLTCGVIRLRWCALACLGACVAEVQSAPADAATKAGRWLFSLVLCICLATEVLA